MFEDLRQQAEQSELDRSLEPVDTYAMREEPGWNEGKILGMTAVQRFVIAIMLLFMTCMVSTLVLLVTEKINFL